MATSQESSSPRSLTLRSLAPWWPVGWLLTSAVFVLALAQVESGMFFAAIYLALNAATVVYVALEVDSRRARKMTIVGWGAALQLPVMLWLLTKNGSSLQPLRPDTSPESHDDAKSHTDARTLDEGAGDSSSKQGGGVATDGAVEAGPVEAGPVEGGVVEAGPVEAGPVEGGLASGWAAGKALKVMTDYGAWPLWGDGWVDNVDPASLPITPELRQRLLAWAQQYDDILVWDDPASSGFASADAEREFEARGRQLTRDLQRELGSETPVRYWEDTP